ncbi:MAG: glycerol kinase GlpK [Bacteroidales bacterium]|nr:glycerol kinase GlpK [Bacteroidales bacterium]
MKQYILSLDQGTSSSRAILFNVDGSVVASAQYEFPQHFPRPGRVEHDPADILDSQLRAAREVIAAHPEGRVAAIGITNQRETTVVWDAATGRPVCNAIVWQDRRTADYCQSLRERGLSELIRRKTGLLPDAYFSATKIRWILEHVPQARERAERGELRFGTVDSWLIWNLTGGRVHATDPSNAARTMLLDIHTLRWDEELLDLFGIPASMMPQVVDSSGICAHTQGVEGIPDGIPVAGIAGDQQAALFGQLCFEPGSVKNTYGTGCFLLMNTGSTPVGSKNQLLTTVAWKIGPQVNYALEGSVFVAGSAVQWLRDGLGLIGSSAEIEPLAASVPDSGGVFFVPALTGLGAPYWNAEARGTVCGLTRGSTAAHLARATLEGIAFQVHDVVRAMERDAGIRLSELRVDGGAARNNLLLQFQSDILGVEVVRPCQTETTAFGAACLAGLGVGLWASPDELRSHVREDRRFVRQLSDEAVTAALKGWEDALRRACL